MSSSTRASSLDDFGMSSADTLQLICSMSRQKKQEIDFDSCLAHKLMQALQR